MTDVAIDGWLVEMWSWGKICKIDQSRKVSDKDDDLKIVGIEPIMIPGIISSGNYETCSRWMKLKCRPEGTYARRPGLKSH